jgi:phosphoribosylformylglycinamidine (FGAM) synthase PurS component
METVKKVLRNLGFESVEDVPMHDYWEVEVPGYMDLTIERVADNHISVSHNYLQNGDVMRDPEIVFEIENTHWKPIEYVQDPMIAQYDPDGLDQVESFASQWGDNLKQQGFIEAAEQMESND